MIPDFAQPHALLRHAYEFAEAAHWGVFRKYTGEPYITHPVAVARILYDHGLDLETVAAGFLHDTMEDCGVQFGQLCQRFGGNVACYVDAVTDRSRPDDGPRAIRKDIDRKHMAHACYHGKSLKLADLIHNTESIVRYDPGFAKIYLEEKRALLKVLDGGHRGLYRIAYGLAHQQVPA